MVDFGRLVLAAQLALFFEAILRKRKRFLWFAPVAGRVRRAQTVQLERSDRSALLKTKYILKLNRSS
jgi:hypothetical protein